MPVRYPVPSSSSMAILTRRVCSFDSGDLQVHKSHSSLTGWEYWDGASWEGVPQGGVDPSYAGNEARFTASLVSGSWYRRVRAGEIS